MVKIMTKVIKIDPQNIDFDEIKIAAKIILEGGLCAFPTETVYGLGANAFDVSAVKKIFKAKGRPQDNPLIVHVSSIDEVYPLVKSVTDDFLLLAEKFWGGPLTMILERSDKVPIEVSAGLSTVAIRLPSHPIATALIKMAKTPIAAPSANLSGKPSPTTFGHVFDDMFGKADVIIDGGNAIFGVESTVLDLTASVPVILRPGAITFEELSAELPDVVLGTGIGAPKSPGMKYRHYAPNAPLFIVEGHDAADRINKLSNENTGVLCYDIGVGEFKAKHVISAGDNAAAYAANLFYNLRKFDELGVSKIYVIPPEEGGIGYAVRNRLFKSAGGNKI